MIHLLIKQLFALLDGEDYVWILPTQKEKGLGMAPLSWQFNVMAEGTKSFK